MGSASDMPVMEETIQMLKELKIGFEVMGDIRPSFP